jgi:hypothetical protein
MLRSLEAVRGLLPRLVPLKRTQVLPGHKSKA